MLTFLFYAFKQIMESMSPAFIYLLFILYAYCSLAVMTVKPPYCFRWSLDGYSLVTFLT